MLKLYALFTDLVLTDISYFFFFYQTGVFNHNTDVMFVERFEG